MPAKNNIDSPQTLLIARVMASFFILCLVCSMSANAHIEQEMPDPIAEVEYQMMLDFEPDDLETRYKLAMVYYRLDKDSLAEEELMKVLEGSPDYFHALEGLGMLRLKQNKLEEAVESLQKALEDKKHESGTFYYLGMAQQRLGKLKEAGNAFASGLQKCKEEPEKKRAFTMEQFQEALAKTNPTR